MEDAGRVHMAEGACQLEGDALLLEHARQPVGADSLVQIHLHHRAQEVDVRRKAGAKGVEQGQQVGVGGRALVRDLAHHALRVGGVRVCVGDLLDDAFTAARTITHRQDGRVATGTKLGERLKFLVHIRVEWHVLAAAAASSCGRCSDGRDALKV